MSEEESGGEHTNEKYHPPPDPKPPRKEPKKARAKKQTPPPKAKGGVSIITDPAEWERLLRDVPLKTGEIRFYRGPPNPVSFK
jgi:hypothetical protein